MDNTNITCRQCHKELTTQEEAAYRSVCEDCYSLGSAYCADHPGIPIADRVANKMYQGREGWGGTNKLYRGRVVRKQVY